MSFQKLVRFELYGKASYGELIETTHNGFRVKKLAGNPFDGLEATEETYSVSKVSPDALSHILFHD